MQDMVNQLSRTLAQANRFLAAQLKARGLGAISPSHGDILVQLFAHGEMTMQDLARAIGRDPSTVTALVKKLVAEGYVRAGKSAGDRRATIVSLTERGRGLEADFDAVSAALAAAQADGIGPDDLETTRATLVAMRQNFEQAMKGDE